MISFDYFNFAPSYKIINSPLLLFFSSPCMQFPKCAYSILFALLFTNAPFPTASLYSSPSPLSKYLSYTQCWKLPGLSSVFPYIDWLSISTVDFNSVLGTSFPSPFFHNFSGPIFLSARVESQEIAALKIMLIFFFTCGYFEVCNFFDIIILKVRDLWCCICSPSGVSNDLPGQIWYSTCFWNKVMLFIFMHFYDCFHTTTAV